MAHRSSSLVPPTTASSPTGLQMSLLARSLLVSLSLILSLATSAHGNETALYFEHEQYNASIEENFAAGTVVASVTALPTDDTEPLGTLLYQLTGEGQDDFVVDRVGTIRTAVILDFETTAQYNLTLEASSTDPIRSPSSTTIIIKVLNGNDNSPVFSQTVYYGYVADHAIPGTPLARVNATDADAVPTNISYTITPGTDASILALFQLDQASGQLTLKQVPSVPLSDQDTFEFGVVANDNGTPPRQSFASVIIQKALPTPVLKLNKLVSGTVNSNVSFEGRVDLVVEIGDSLSLRGGFEDTLEVRRHDTKHACCVFLCTHIFWCLNHGLVHAVGCTFPSRRVPWEILKCCRLPLSLLCPTPVFGLIECLCMPAIRPGWSRQRGNFDSIQRGRWSRHAV